MHAMHETSLDQIFHRLLEVREHLHKFTVINGTSRQYCTERFKDTLKPWNITEIFHRAF